MAIAIKPTPVLKGREAIKLSEKIEANKTRPVSNETYQKTKNAFHTMKLKSNIKF